jgi:hypothetical protein
MFDALQLTVHIGEMFTHTLNVGKGDQTFKWLSRIACDALARESRMPEGCFTTVNIFDSV